ncbi:MAG: nickel ABC transporter permease [Bacillota bacterium]
MIKYIIKRILMLIPVLIGVSIIIFLVLHLGPGDPAEVMLGPQASQAEVEQLRENLGLNEPLVVQYLVFARNALQGDFGRSIRTNTPVMKEILSRLPNTIQLSLVGILFSIIIGFPLGIYAAMNQNKLGDMISSFLALVGFSVPNFWAGLMLMLLFAVFIPILPSSGHGTWQHLVLPGIALGIQTTAVVARMTRSSMLEVIRQDYVKTAKAKGIDNKIVLFRHIIRNALIPVVTITGLYFGHSLGGVVVTETVFSYPGIGRLLVNAIRSQDYPVVQAGVLFFAFGVGIVNLVVDIIYAYLDPRIKAQYRAIKEDE